MATRISRYIVAVVVSLTLIVFRITETNAATITLKSGVDINSPIVRLGDVAAVMSPGSSERIGSLEKIPLCSAPPPAETLILGREIIESAIKASGTDVSSFEFAGPDRVVVRRVYELVMLDELQREFSEHVSSRTGWPPNSFLLEPPKNFTPIPVPAGQRITRVETAPDEDFSGSVQARFQVLVDGKPQVELTHRFGVERYVDALVAARKIGRGQSLNLEDVEIRKVEQSLVEKKSFTREDQVVGLQATRTISPGTILDTELLEEPPVILKGTDAMVTWEGNGFSVTTKGRVLEDGCANGFVRVRLASKKIVRAMVVSSDTLRITQEGERDERPR